MSLYYEYLQELENDLRIEAEMAAEAEALRWESETLEALKEAERVGDWDLYSDLYKDLYGVRPR